LYCHGAEANGQSDRFVDKFMAAEAVIVGCDYPVVFVSLVLASRFPALALTTTLFITNIAASLKASTFNNYVYPVITSYRLKMNDN